MTLRSGWLGKGCAGVIAGFAIAVLASGLFRQLTPAAGAGKLQLSMWLIAPIWSAIFSFVFLFRSAWRAWICLTGTAAILAFLFAVLTP